MGIGLLIAADLGLFVTIGGRNTNDFGDADGKVGICRVEPRYRPPFPKRTISNLQPFVSLGVGYELFSSPSFALSGSIRVWTGAANGAGRVSDEEYERLIDDPACLETIGGKSSDYAVYGASAKLQAAFTVIDRLALTIEATGGGALLLPDPRLHVDHPDAGDPAFAPTVGGSIGTLYLTPLDDIAIGLDLRFEMILLREAPIPSVQVSFPVRYTF